MNRAFVRAAVFAAVLMLSSCGSDVDATSDPNQSVAAGEPNGVDPDEAGSAESSTRLWVKPDLVDCVGEMAQKCMQIAEAEDGEYRYFYDQIAGFDFVEGTSYVIDVRIDEISDPPADGSSLAYTLVEVIERN